MINIPTHTHFQAVLPGIYKLALPFSATWSNVYLLTGETNILIDSGPGEEEIDGFLLPALERMGLTPRDIGWLVNTHAHMDHVGGHGRLQALNIPVASSEIGAERLQDPKKFGTAIRQKYPANSPPPPARLVGVRPDRVLKEGEILAGRIRLIYTPGHDADAVTWLCLKTNTLITGDAVQGYGAYQNALAFYQWLSPYLSTLRKLSATGADNLLAAHHYAPYGETALGKEAVRAYLEAGMAAAREYHAFLQGKSADGEKQLRDLTLALIGHMGTQPPPALFLEMHTVAAHLAAGEEHQFDCSFGEQTATGEGQQPRRGTLLSR